MSLFPAPSDATANALSGSNQVGVREFNERVLLHAIRVHGSLPKAELARLTRLSTQAVSVIIERLLEEGMVQRLAARRGAVGQPSRPIALRPDAAYALGVAIGRRRLDVLLLDFGGAPRWRGGVDYASPQVEAVFAAIGAQLAWAHAFLGEADARRIAGIGLAAPLSFGGWREQLQMAAQDADAWARTDLRQRLQDMTPLPVTFAKDTAAAGMAELATGRGRGLRTYLYVFVDTLVGGSLVIDGQPHGGLHGNAGALASLPLGLHGASGGPGLGAGADGRVGQLLEAASLLALEGMLLDAGLAAFDCMDERLPAGPAAEVVRRWIARAADALAYAACSAACLLDLEGVVVDGALGRTLLHELLQAMQAALERYGWQGVARPRLHAGEAGADAKATGAAWLPLHAHFAPAHGLFLKAAVPGARAVGKNT